MSKSGRIPNSTVEHGIKFVRIAGLHPNSSNARTHSVRQIRQIARSIERFGFTNPVLIDGNNKIICGHGRVAGAQLLGLTTVPTLKIEHLNDEEVRAYVIADNRLAEKAGWNKEILAIELQGLLDLNFEVELTGFETAEIDLLLEDINAGADESDDACPLYEPRWAITKPNDIWILGTHRLVCGDARDRSAYALLMNNESAQFTITDPPYNVKIDGHVSGLGRVRHREFAMACGELNEAEFATFLEQAFQQIAAHSVDGAICSAFIDWRHMSEMLVAGRKVFSELKNVCIWVKPNGGMGSFYRSRHELIFIWKHGKSRHLNTFELGQYGRYRTNVWEYAGVNSVNTDHSKESAHPTIKPVLMIADAIKDCSQRGDLILDPFSGTGTTIAAAQRTGRRARAIEIDPHFCDVAIRRWQSQTGQHAIHAKTGRSFGDLEAHVSCAVTRRGLDEHKTKGRTAKQAPLRRAR